MRTEPRPTRAEVSDAAHAVDSGVDAIMLAGETAVGRYPVKAVQTLDAIIRDAETMPLAVAVSDRGVARARRSRPRDLRGGGDARRRAAPPRPSSRSRAAARPPGCCRRCGRRCRSTRPPTSRRFRAMLALAWGVVPVLADLERRRQRSGQPHRRDAGRARRRAGRIGGRAGEHHARSGARPVELPEGAARTCQCGLGSRQFGGLPLGGSNGRVL